MQRPDGLGSVFAAETGNRVAGATGRWIGRPAFCDIGRRWATGVRDANAGFEAGFAIPDFSWAGFGSFGVFTFSPDWASGRAWISGSVRVACGWAISGCCAGTREDRVENPANPGSWRVFFRSRAAWVRRQKTLFLKIPAVAGLPGALWAGKGGQDLAHVLISPHCGMREREFLRRSLLSNSFCGEFS